MGGVRDGDVQTADHRAVQSRGCSASLAQIQASSRGVHHGRRRGRSSECDGAVSAAPNFVLNSEPPGGGGSPQPLTASFLRCSLSAHIQVTAPAPHVMKHLAPPPKPASEVGSNLFVLLSHAARAGHCCHQQAGAQPPPHRPYVDLLTPP